MKPFSFAIFSSSFHFIFSDNVKVTHFCDIPIILAIISGTIINRLLFERMPNGTIDFVRLSSGMGLTKSIKG